MNETEAYLTKKHLVDDAVEMVYPGVVDVALDVLKEYLLEDLLMNSLNSTH